ncbi:RNA polymerase sigma factor [candidate division KSB1 bacterium]|nr:RNA polymerase sigma factor [candidate division KSB1 bacterium]NIR70609.1 RNA polymerase sigma factor [candidate division KSB1 bacterium]NIS24554.1 RNA polymerase sigma factor [candidate division KSB1 bacterium]NIT71472.1 RNA polymerase sigma factor [candidate division KSB1 bacterium]NIU25163.1 RNA polymerase sigma factor [candidate division KSB1 bacterium]
MPDPDSRLIRKAKQGNERAFKTLVEKYELKVLNLAFDILGNYADAKDVAQDVFIRVLDKFHTFEGRSRFSTWLYRITVNLATDYHRRADRRQFESLDVNPDSGDRKTSSDDMAPQAEVELKVEQEELNSQIRDALDILSPNQRIAIVLRYFHQKSTKEIAEILECHENTVRIHVFRALKNLRKCLIQIQAE